MPKFKLKIGKETLPSLVTAAKFADVRINEQMDQLADQVFIEGSCTSADKMFEMGILFNKLVSDPKSKSKTTE